MYRLYQIIRTLNIRNTYFVDFQALDLFSFILYLHENYVESMKIILVIFSLVVLLMNSKVAPLILF
jgi:hypothetical protein